MLTIALLHIKQPSNRKGERLMATVTEMSRAGMTKEDIAWVEQKFQE
jgi:hypothetical protein